MVVTIPVEETLLGKGLAFPQSLDVCVPGDMNEAEQRTVRREGALADRHSPARKLRHDAVIERIDSGGANLVVLEVVDLIARWIERRQVVVDAG